MSEEVVPMAGVDAMRERIAAHPWPRGGVEVTRANRGYTLYSRRTGGPVARLRPTGKADNVQILWWRRETWATPGDFGPLTLRSMRRSSSSLPRASSGSTPDAQNVTKRQHGARTMDTITAEDSLTLLYKDWGQGQPIVFHHGCR